MTYTFEDTNGVNVEVDLSTTETMTFAVGDSAAVLDPLDVGLLLGLIQTWLTRGGYPK